MEVIYKVDLTLNVPIYQQLADAIRAGVKKGELKTGHKLPTVQELAEELAVARGTIKRAYDELEKEGLVEKVRGSGTYIKYQPMESGSRKEIAMAAIDELLILLEEMGFSPSEISIFLNLKLREWGERDAYVKVAVVECNPENLAQMSIQLGHIPQVELHSFLLESLEKYPYKLGEDYDLIVVTAAHAEYIESVLPARKRMAQVALRLSVRSMARIIRLKAGTRVGIMGYSSRFCELLYSTCEKYKLNIELERPSGLGDVTEVETYLKDKDVILVPKAYEQYCGAGVADILRDFRGELIKCYYEMDEGSLLYLELKIRRLLEERTI